MPATSGAAAISFVQLNRSRLHRGFPQVEGLEKRRRRAREATMHPRSWHSRLRLFPPLPLLRLQPPFLTVVRARALARVLSLACLDAGRVRRGRAGPRGGAVRAAAALSCEREPPTPPSPRPGSRPVLACGLRPLDVLCPPAPGRALGGPSSSTQPRPPAECGLAPTSPPLLLWFHPGVALK